MRISLDVEVKDFTTPNCVVPIQPPGVRQEGWKEVSGIPLKELDAKTLDQLCRNFRADIFRKACKPDPEIFK